MLAKFIKLRIFYSFQEKFAVHPELKQVKDYLLRLQTQLCSALESFEPQNRFIVDQWQRAAGGAGDTRILEEGAVIERAGVNFSQVFGDTLPAAASAKRPELTDCRFQAIGVSAVIHPSNPYVPSAHMNVRLFVAEKEHTAPIWWFGGGYDLTPYYGFTEDCVHWHQTAKAACASFGEDVYAEFKRNCDDYFFIKFRNEARGIGGLFFDDLNRWKFSTCFAFIQSIGDSFQAAYLPLVKKRKDTSYGQRERDFQLYRRGRYVEFNLIYDRGTLFGLQSNGRAESILMSLPPMVKWHYDWQAEKASAEAKLGEQFLKPRAWV